MSPYTTTKGIIQILSIYKNDTSSIALPGWTILEELIFRVTLAAGPIFFNNRPTQEGEYWMYCVLSIIKFLTLIYLVFLMANADRRAVSFTLAE